MTIYETLSAADANQLALWPSRLNTATNLSIQFKTLCQAPSATFRFIFKDIYTSQQKKPH